MKNETKRNQHAISAHFRHAGPHKDRKLEQLLDRQFAKNLTREARDAFNNQNNTEVLD